MKFLTAMVLSAFTCGSPVAAAVGDEIPPPRGQHQHEVMPPADPVPGESLYQLKIDLTSQDGKQTSLAALRGTPALVTMFYTSCQDVCPLIAATLRRMEDALASGQRARLRVLMVSFDPERDTPQALENFAVSNNADNPRWLLTRAPENKVRELAAALGIRYRKLDSGMFSHSTVIALLDADGVIQAHTSTLSELDPDFMRKLQAALK